MNELPQWCMRIGAGANIRHVFTQQPKLFGIERKNNKNSKSANNNEIIMKVKLRNVSYMPYLETEGVYLCPMPSPPPNFGCVWHSNLKPHERLFYHQTLSSVRYCKRFQPTPDIPRDSLDFQLQSRYDHAREIFPERVDAVLQRETCASHKSPQVSFRVLRNTQTIEKATKEALGHPLKIGGTTEKISPHSVKLINSGIHNQLVNNGFSRQPADGNFFRY